MDNRNELTFSFTLNLNLIKLILQEYTLVCKSDY